MDSSRLGRFWIRLDDFLNGIRVRFKIIGERSEYMRERKIISKLTFLEDFLWYHHRGKTATWSKSGVSDKPGRWLSLLLDRSGEGDVLCLRSEAEVVIKYRLSKGGLEHNSNNYKQKKIFILLFQYYSHSSIIKNTQQFISKQHLTL